MNKKLIVGNWKMNPGTLNEARKIARNVRRAALTLVHTEAIICPPSVFLVPLIPRKKARHFSVGAQSAYFAESGAYTGLISTAMLRDVGVEYVIVGHSEERQRGDTDEMVSKKVRAVIEAGMTPIVCVGESSRDDVGATHFGALREQIRNSFENVPKKAAGNIVLAYEPVWAIGAKDSMVPEQIYEMSLFVKKVFSDVFSQESAVKISVLYGGAVNSRNAADIVSIGKVDGLLVGRESLNTVSFVELLKAVDAVK
ncbi:MAG: triose-phosphate isomerase [Candidatus Taylorbacteria bacterium]